VARHIIPGPRIFWSGQIIATTGGHGDEVTSTGTGREKSGSDGSSSRRIADGPWEWRVAVRGQLRSTADWVKIAAPFNKEEVSAAVDEAHQQGARVAVDSFGPYTDMAIEAGVDSLEHPLAMSAQAVPLMVKYHTAFVPTLVAFNNLLTTGYPSAGIPSGGFYYTRSRRFTIEQATHLRRVGEAWQAGVPIGVGTDIPFEGETRYPDAYFLELDYLKQAGMSNRDVLASATSVGARILGLNDKVGAIAPAHLADILVIEGNPVDDLRNLRRIKLVFAGGQIAPAP
jgi:imidazolonepropionase-like amidohydrolase